MARNMKVAAVAAGGAALVSLLGAAAVKAQRRYCLQVLRTKGGLARVHMVGAEDGAPVRVLSQGGVFQSATYLGERRFEPVFAYYRGFDAMFAAEDALGHPIKNVLMLGGGGFAYPKHLLTTRRRIHLDVVELDAAVVRAARRWFYLDDLEARLASPDARGNTLRIIVGDGREFLEHATGQMMRAGDLRGRVEEAKAGFAVDGAGGSLRRVAEGELVLPRYDAVVNDAFLGRAQAAGLATVEAARAVRARLVEGGLYLMNVVSSDGGWDVGFLRDEVATLREVFTHVHVLQTSDAEFGGEDNYLLIATDNDASFEDAIPYDDDFPGTPLRDVHP